MSSVHVGSSDYRYAPMASSSAQKTVQDAAVSREMSDAIKTGDFPAVTVTLSPEAQQRLEADKAAAEKLQQMVANASTNDASDKRAAATDLSWDDLMDVDVVEPDPSKVLQPIGREQQIAQMRDAKTALVMGRAERANPAGAAALRDAIANGTVTIRSAASVEGVNYKTTVTPAADGSGSRHTFSFDPSPEVKAQIDSGRAMAMWDSKLGDIFMTW